jgi:hypothetical protein
VELLAMVREHDSEDRRFQAALHGVKLADHEGRVHGSRQALIDRIKQRHSRRG